MSDFLDALETRSADEREQDLCAKLPLIVSHAIENAPGWREHLAEVDGSSITSFAALAGLPVLRKHKLMERQRDNPPFGGFATVSPDAFDRVFMSPGPIWEPQPEGVDPWNAMRPLFAAGFRKGDIVHNVLAYHATPGGFILDQGAVALGCAVFPSGPGNTETQIAAMRALEPVGYVGTPDYLKTILDKADEFGTPITSLKKALVSGGALFPAMREGYKSRGIDVYQTYATADLGCISYESPALEGMIINENYVVEIVKPGTDECLPDGEVGEVVVTVFNKNYPLIRFGTGDMSAILAGESPCGRTNKRLKGWMGRADQRTKVKGMFVDPAQIDALSKAMPELGRLRLEVGRENDQDVMVLRVESGSKDEALRARIEAAILHHCKLRGGVRFEDPGSLPNDGQVIADKRSYD